MTRLAPLAGAAALAAACGTPPEQDACVGIVDVSLAQGRRGPDGEWIVGEWTSPRLHWPAFTTFRVRHGLNRPVTSVECWASFTTTGAIAKQIGSVCLVIPTCGTEQGVTDSVVIVRNSGAQDFWTRLVLR